MVGAENMVEFYLALLAVQMATLGLIVAGIVTLLQMLHKAKPRRVASLLISPFKLYSYVFFMAATLVLLATAAWAVTFDPRGIGETFAMPGAGGALVAACLVGLFWFVHLVYKTRRLLEAESYLAVYIASVRTRLVRDYLFRWYSARPQPYEADDEPNLSAATHREHQREREASIKAWDARVERTKDISDQFQPIREYLKDNAFSSYDYGTACGLRFFSKLFDRTFEDIGHNTQPHEYYYLAKYFADSCEEFFAIFQKTASEKRQRDTIRLVAQKGHVFLNAPRAEGFLAIIRCLENIAKTTDDEDNIILCIELIHELVDAYLELNKKATWNNIAEIFEGACLSVTRLAETYYLHKDNQLRTIPIISHYTGEYRTVTVALVDFFDSFDDLGSRYPNVYPVLYFEAIEAVTEVLFTRYGEMTAKGHAGTGLNVAYRHLAKRLYDMYRNFGDDAIANNKPELLALCIINLRRIIKPAKNWNLTEEQAALTQIILELTCKGLVSLGDITIRDTRTISEYVEVTLQKHATTKLIKDALTQLQEQKIVDPANPKLKKFIAHIRSKHQNHA